MDLLRCTFHLNGNSIGTLSCPGVGFFSAFSGNSSATNNSNKTELKDIGPLPCGRYYIILRGRGGTFARFRDDANAFFTGSDRSTWFALYRDDGKIDDSTLINGVLRGMFRLHPIGPSGLSKGCITLYSQQDFDILARAILRTSGKYVGNYLIAHGVIQVY
ncbi:DUF2778 domain-containing protein [Cronobacter sakazakii]|uniref:DUF2778 domain-containing protein n=1 Tax=Cronobacter sakazakii TaxID=28141 RepID=A0AA45C412_CROSK|nr:DUF2778 domain-containing protein [Cronobacter sakazakii]EIZ8956405.1 DUF2778 domain-containing protein [Cronobacter sakazakii]ELY3573666.1 DUF2778 domain-containing protein [Cronobacter sakazakii]ELY6332116.1 DUF2778 domain-containing protein [Cronobacter sakazakii]ELY6334729.1 DUF2778 domain-containing protein [Cronobacter sakazakii]KAB0849727.1 DUF2778 domain-containing protein [Cronobacter sakazakii]